MCCTNSSNFVADLHSLNGNCSNDTLKHEKLHHPVTTAIYVTTAFLCILLGLITHYKYNSVTVLNLTVRSHVISNTSWIVYMAVLFLRSTVGAVIYGITPSHEDHSLIQMVYFIADGALKSLEVLCLLWALHHQWKYRSSGFFQQEINSFNSGEYSVTGSDQGIRPNRLFKSKSGALFVVEFLFTMLFLILLEALASYLMHRSLEALYWTYLGMFWIQCITTIVWVISIAKDGHEEGPTLMTKILLVVGVLIILPGDIPSFVWSFCILNQCKCKPRSFLTCYDIALFLSIPSVIIFFLVLRREFLRLDQEAQYSVVRGEVDSLLSSVHSQSSDQQG